MLSAVRYDGIGSPKLSVASMALSYKIDIELGVRRVLSSDPELFGEWLRLVDEKLEAASSADRTTEPGPISAEQKKLTDRVTILCGRIFQKRRLDRVREYWTKVKRRAEP
jgi:hypothetical protein